MFRFWLTILSIFIVTSCENKPHDPVVAIVNGIEIQKSEVIGDHGAIRRIIEEKVIESESKRIGVNQKELFEFFEIFKTRDIPKDQIEKFYKAEFKDKNINPETQKILIDLMREKQYSQAKEKYMSELIGRSTIWIVEDGKKSRPDFAIQK